MNLTYAEVGRTAGELPVGYRHIRRTMRLGSGRDRFGRAADALLAWDLHRRAGLTVTTASPTAKLDADVILGWGVGRLRLPVPCRVVRVVDEPSLRGFAYGTLPGHPETGEESFMIRLDDGGDVHMDIVAFSRPARWYSRLGGPVARLVQRRMTSRYLKVLRDV